MADDLVPSSYPPADITAREFERWVVDLYESAQSSVQDLRVAPHETVVGVDGDYDIDATVRYRLAGMDFLILVEAKRHRHPIKRELVASLHSKVVSTGAQKGVMLSTAPYQRGAIEFAKVHGIALVTVTEGRFTILARGQGRTEAMSREEAEANDILNFVGYSVEQGDDPRTTIHTIVSAEYPDYLKRLLFDGVDATT